MSKPVIYRRRTTLHYAYVGEPFNRAGRFQAREVIKTLTTFEGNEVYKELKIPCRRLYFNLTQIGQIEYYKYTKALTQMNHLWWPEEFAREELSWVAAYNSILDPTGWKIGKDGWELV